eukprot:CAMPEP_0206233916 /NCGR_PEP_ID=MMETSP0047_2-20121206/12282_1 /ASSEMBLY_ACC=CAM_ASM_000192 /TAXON_ID=195065 /ORGANISM="Chroomonas mesostigmatica_cf, Strain CCMP1168" /LENGTH=86 /DNA_ID=CAMNT_0053657907 /DNA_START=528 /DNA_END=788 /DNA_ORIENTATION=-
MSPAAGHVTTHPSEMVSIIFQLTDDAFPPHHPTAAVAPQMQCVVLTGTPILEKKSTVNMAPIEMQKLRAGEWYVILWPSTRMILCP